VAAVPVNTPINKSNTNTLSKLIVDIIFYNFIAIVTENDFISRNFLQKIKYTDSFFLRNENIFKICGRNVESIEKWSLIFNIILTLNLH